MTELKIKTLSDGCVTLFSNREFFGYGREILITPEARIELMDFLFENYPDETIKVGERHMP
jgi:hypothetical protein